MKYRTLTFASVALLACVSSGCAAVTATMHDQFATQDRRTLDDLPAPLPAQASAPATTANVMLASGNTLGLRVVPMQSATSPIVTPRYVYMMAPIASEGDTAAPLVGEAVAFASNAESTASADAPKAAKPRPAQAKLYWFLSGR